MTTDRHRWHLEPSGKSPRKDEVVWSGGGEDRIQPVKPAPSAYVLLGIVAAGERRSREALSVGRRAVDVAMWPATRGWQSRLAAPLRRRAADATSGLEHDGRELLGRVRNRAQATGAAVVRRAEDEVRNSGLADELVERLLSSGAFDQVITVAINHPATEAMVGNALDAPGLDRLIARVMESHLIDEITAQLLESDELRHILDYVTRSPELRAALAHQSVGMAEDLAVSVRSRSNNADAATERFARAVFRRRPRAEGP